MHQCFFPACLSTFEPSPIHRSLRKTHNHHLCLSARLPSGAVKMKMEELFQYLKTLRSQMNDVADQAAKISVEEHMHCTAIQTLQKDLDLVRNETRQVKEETVQMTKAKGQICLQINEKNWKISSLESDSYTLNQTLELMQLQKLCLSAKMVERRAYYTKVAEDVSGQLKGLQEWINAHNSISQTGKGSVNEKTDGTEFREDVSEIMIMEFNAAKAKFEKLEELKSNLVLENTKLRQSVEILKSKMNYFKPELRKMDGKILEVELQALLSDKAGETDYLSLCSRHKSRYRNLLLMGLDICYLQSWKLAAKEISHKVRCSCGEEYNVKLDLFA